MGQVPTSNNSTYLFVGNGKVSRHFQFYFHSLKIPYSLWTRNSTESFDKAVDNSEKVLVLIKDDEIENFILKKNKHIHNGKVFIHFSGLLSTPLAESAHPLMTFNDNLYDLDTYKKIIFVTEFGRKKFEEIFPELPNKSYQISAQEKLLYHAFCVMSGNFTSILWQNFFEYLDSLNIAKEDAHIYLKKITDNILNSSSPLTGPFERKDFDSINKHIEALKNHPMKNIYISFWEFYKSKIEEKKLEEHC